MSRPRVAVKVRPNGGQPRTLCHQHACGRIARYQATRTARYYCSDHAADVAPHVPLREIDSLTEALRITTTEAA